MRIKEENLGLDAARAVAVGPSDQLLALDEALQQLEEKEPRLSRRSEEHTSELQSQSNLVCRLLLEKKKKKETDNPRCQLQLPRLLVFRTVAALSRHPR